MNLGRGGSIVGGESLRDSLVIYSEQAINVMDFTGDALGWRRRTVSSEAGWRPVRRWWYPRGTHFFVSLVTIGHSTATASARSCTTLRKRLASRMNVEKLGNSWAAHNPTS